MPAQQQNPIKIGLPPVLISFTRSVFRPMAAIAMTMRNLDSSLKGEKKAELTPAWVQTVAIRDARMKNRMKKGKILRN